ncbi:4Fe-4S binding protein [Blautia producta]|uniref:4Fe-4S binding protein n=1 Tax=Blautia producta TaxID=33035 RepID=UPI001022AB3A|nr:4Fe-4S binding protein [Blautia producta]
MKRLKKPPKSSILPWHKKPSACVDCGSCKKHCPQGFDIPKYMEEMRVMMEH